MVDGGIEVALGQLVGRLVHLVVGVTELVRLATVQRSAEIIFAAFRERCLSIPGKIAAVCEMRSRGEVEETVRAEIYECLAELSGPILPVDAAPMEDRSDAADDDEGEIIR